MFDRATTLPKDDEKRLNVSPYNVGTLISFRIGGTDAMYLAKEFYPVFNEDDLINLPRYGMYLKLMADGATSLPFGAYSLPKEVGGTSCKKRLSLSHESGMAVIRKSR